MNVKQLALGAVAAAVLASPLTAEKVFAAGEQFVPVTLYRTGPYANTGEPLMGGYMDYMRMINARDGGVNGVKLVYEECETGYKPDRMVECYQRLKNQGETGAGMFNPLGTGLTYAVIEDATKDKIPVITIGYGRTDATDGSVWKYVFPLITNYWSQNTAKIKFIGQREGGMENLKGKKIAYVIHDSAYGKETQPVIAEQAKKYGFEVKTFPVAHPGLDQKAVWLQIARQYKPDWVILRGWGVMNQTSIKEAARVGFPRDKIVGVWWSGSEQDTVPAGAAAEGYISANFHGPGTDYPVIQDVLKYVQDAGKGTVDKSEVGTIMYNRGVVYGIVNIEAIRVAQGKFGNKPLTGEQIQWGFEHLDFTPERIAELGATGLVPPFKTSCFDHEGQAPVKFQQWQDGKWVAITDWIETDQAMVRPMVEASAKKYAAEKGITPRNCATEN
ncbi:MAG: ABC transporter substrate-binding protein [Alphaproteobacteria bacterium]|nr:ABC transporter substrate-binding protein [Alphaproteobacteria bacterium]